MDELQRLLNSKIQESEQLRNRLAKFQPNCEEIPNEKRPDSENRKLALQLQHLKEEKSQLEKWNSILNEKADINKIKRDHEIELAAIKNQYESKILDLEKEIEILKINLSQIEEEKNNFKELNDVLLDQREAWNKEQNEYQKTKLTLQEKIKAAEELEARLQEKINKYDSRLAVMEREHQEEISKLQLQIFGLTKSGCHKENKAGEMVPTERSLKTRNILKCLKQTANLLQKDKDIHLAMWLCDPARLPEKYVCPLRH
ncbi:golgin subfamily A member 3-like isoform X2 [Stegodyphus dumicola]|uniref:golgin subfamily A member 3-like isoform X2 n=1 Tax=Stegodyphus dumicola TaxID=202533 RepID=UPI0015AE934F|nr:golgin subfamily A member 3-like isoform X2 [Stegodyphus dumicola]